MTLLHHEQEGSRVTRLERLWWLPEAKTLQRQGYTFTEIATILSVPRTWVVNALYWGERE